MTYSRRDLCLLLSGLAAAPAMAADEKVLGSSVLIYESLRAYKSKTSEFRPMFAGQLHNSCYLEVHQTRLAPGAMPHAAHHHVHEEMFMVREGTVEITINGKATPMGPGSVGFAGSNDEHGIRNAGDGPAEYFVVAFGKD